MTINIATRSSKLALVQTEFVISEIQKFHPHIDFNIVPIKTTGDKILDKTLDKIGGKGLFIKELELALQDGKADIAVHSLKDMTVDFPENLPILAFSPRENPFDVLVLPKNTNTIDFSKPFGTSSQRRKIQLEALFPEAKITPIRGNVISRLEKLDSGAYAGLILAYAGLKRLNLEHRISRIFTPEEILPSACQGVLAVQGRYDVEPFFLKEFNHKESAFTSLGERAFLKELDGGCSSPVACFGTISEDILTLTGLNVDSNHNIIKDSLSGTRETAVELGMNLAKLLKGDKQ